MRPYSPKPMYLGDLILITFTIGFTIGLLMHVVGLWIVTPRPQVWTPVQIELPSATTPQTSR